MMIISPRFSHGCVYTNIVIKIWELNLARDVQVFEITKNQKMASRTPKRGTVSQEVTEQDIKEAFDVFDTDKDGFIFAEEVGTVIRALGKCPYQSEVNEIIKEIGEGKKVDLRGFQAQYRKKFRKPQDLERDMRNAFNALDKDGTGQILEAELRQILGTLGEILSSEEVDLLMRDCNADSEGAIRYDNFVDLLVS